MRIVNLIENTVGPSGCAPKHGLSFYIETKKHRLLMDTGPSDLFLQNAEKLGIDLKKVDLVVLSHGHYDHGGGILAFHALNPEAKICLRRSAFGGYYSVSPAPDGSGTGEKIRYIGLDPGIARLPVLMFMEDETDLDEELTVFAVTGSGRPYPDTNRSLKIQTEEGLLQDDFRHEQCLLVRQNGKTYLFSGCAHHGILNVMDSCLRLYGKEPDVVISGFHTLNHAGYSEKDIRYFEDTANALKSFRTLFYTCHCTGEEPYQMMNAVMGDQIRYVHSGDEIDPDLVWNGEKCVLERT